MTRADYVTLYTHPDKYLPASAGGNPFVDDDGGQTTKVYNGEKNFWVLVDSTTMTFASTHGILRQDKHLISKWIQNPYPADFRMFLDLRDNAGHALIYPVPTYATHTEVAWLSPLHGTGVTSWESIMKEQKELTEDVPSDELLEQRLKKYKSNPENVLKCEEAAQRIHDYGTSKGQKITSVSKLTENLMSVCSIHSSITVEEFEQNLRDSIDDNIEWAESEND